MLDGQRVVYEVPWEVKRVGDATYELVSKKRGSFGISTDQGKHIPDERNMKKREGIVG